MKIRGPKYFSEHESSENFIHPVRIIDHQSDDTDFTYSLSIVETKESLLKTFPGVKIQPLAERTPEPGSEALVYDTLATSISQVFRFPPEHRVRVMDKATCMAIIRSAKNITFPLADLFGYTFCVGNPESGSRFLRAERELYGIGSPLIVDGALAGISDYWKHKGRSGFNAHVFSDVAAVRGWIEEQINRSTTRQV